MVKELRPAGVDTMEAGIRFLPDFMEDYDRQFSVVPSRSAYFHRADQPVPGTNDGDPVQARAAMSDQADLSFERKRILLQATKSWLGKSAQLG